MINFIRRMFSSKQVTEEHFPDYKCKGICHDGMRCVDLPNHAEICTSKELILTPETVAFLREEIKKGVDQRWNAETAAMLKAAKVDPIVRRKACC